MRMLENEGFAWESYIDIFDGGPTMTARTDQVRTIREAERQRDRVAGAANVGGEKALVGTRAAWRFPRGLRHVERGRRRRSRSTRLARRCSGSSAGDTVAHVARW